MGQEALWTLTGWHEHYYNIATALIPTLACPQRRLYLAEYCETTYPSSQVPYRFAKSGDWMLSAENRHWLSVTSSSMNSSSTAPNNSLPSP